MARVLIIGARQVMDSCTVSPATEAVLERYGSFLDNSVHGSILLKEPAQDSIHLTNLTFACVGCTCKLGPAV